MRYEKDMFYYIDEHLDEQFISMPLINGKSDAIVAVEPIGYLQNEAIIRTNTSKYRVEWLKKKDFTRMILIEGPKEF